MKNLMVSSVFQKCDTQSVGQIAKEPLVDYCLSTTVHNVIKKNYNETLIIT